MVDYESIVGKFLCHRKDAPMDDGLIYRVTNTRICYVGGGEHWITKYDFENRKGLPEVCTVSVSVINRYGWKI